MNVPDHWHSTPQVHPSRAQTHRPTNVPTDQPTAAQIRHSPTQVHHQAAQLVAGLLVALAASLAAVAPLLLRLWLATHDARIGGSLL